MEFPIYRDQQYSCQCYAYLDNPQHGQGISPRVNESCQERTTQSYSTQEGRQHSCKRIGGRTQEKGEYTPIPPFFWDSSGRAAVHGTMTSAQKYFGEMFLMDMMMEPEKCLKIMNWIADAFVVLVRHFAEICNIELTCVHVGECSACMISPELFQQFVVPATSRIGAAFGSLRLHSCGNSTHIIESTKNITGLTTLDLGGESSITKIRETFGKDFPVSIAPMTVDFAAETSEPILNWAEKVINDNAGGDLTIVYHLEPDYKLDIVRALEEFVLKQQ